MTPFKQAHESSRSRRIDVTPDGMIWYVDEPRGYLGRIDPATGETKEWHAPGGAGSRPYALTKDDQGRLWFSETGPVKQLVGFDPKTEKFFANTVSGNIRHMQFHADDAAMWFGTDANKIGRIALTPRQVEPPLAAAALATTVRLMPRPLRRRRSARLFRRIQGAVVPRLPFRGGAELRRRTCHDRGHPREVCRR